ncbi:hypothetical protein Tco_1540336 [Tanacetum coccineum]
METQNPLLKDEDGEEVDVHMYRSMIGSLMYLTSSRPDIMFTVCASARYQVNPKVSHFYAMKRIFSYLKGQPKLGLWYPKDSPFDLVAYTDSDYDGASLDRKFTTGELSRSALWSLNEDILKITVLKTNTPYPSRRYGVSVPALTKDHKRNEVHYARIYYKLKMDNPNITMEEYIRLEEEKARRRGKVYNWETATYAIVFNDMLTSEAALSCEPTVSSLNNDEIDFRISFDESDDEDCTLGGNSRVVEMILARVSSGFAGEKVWDDIPTLHLGFVLGGKNGVWESWQLWPLLNYNFVVIFALL